MTDSQASKNSHSEWAEFLEEVAAAEAARQEEEEDDPLGDPETLTLGELERILFDLDQLNDPSGAKGREWQGASPRVIDRQIRRRRELLARVAGLEVLTNCIGGDITVDSLKGIYRRLARLMRKNFTTIDQLTLVQAISILMVKT